MILLVIANWWIGYMDAAEDDRSVGEDTEYKQGKREAKRMVRRTGKQW